ncbi:response regulator transcription factor [Fusobacterium ulcerans]|uniref:response regulator transcription factor n=1 Tax=Fusobacterium ulcerans TaxID=861 RepID=UPI0026EA42A8|nr:response regulator transcription factor [Fusobacterium ulcerans]
MKKILIVEDEKEIRNILKVYLLTAGYEVTEAADGEEAMKIFYEKPFDLVVLDIMLPKKDGWSICREIKEYSSVPVIIITARDNENDEVFGFEIGADDYMKKPFDPRELVLRIKKFLKTTDREIKNEKYRFKDIEVDESRHMVTANGEEVELSKKEYDLLLLLIKNRDLVITRERILDKVWNSNYYTGDRTVDVYISKLRDKIPELSGCIKTVKGVGYKLEEKK